MVYAPAVPASRKPRTAYAEQLEAALISKGTPQAALALRLGVPRQTVHGYVHGSRSPDPEMSQRIEKVLDARLGHLLGYRSFFDGEDDPTPPGGAMALDAEQLELAARTARLPPDDRAMVHDLVDRLLDGHANE